MCKLKNLSDLSFWCYIKKIDYDLLLFVYVIKQQLTTFNNY